MLTDAPIRSKSDPSSIQYYVINPQIKHRIQSPNHSNSVYLLLVNYINYHGLSETSFWKEQWFFFYFSSFYMNVIMMNIIWDSKWYQIRFPPFLSCFLLYFYYILKLIDGL